MTVTKKQSSTASSRDLKHRVLTCLHKLSDRDTHSSAAAELDSIAKTLSSDSLPSFLSSIVSTDTSDKSPVRKQCLRLISLLSESHGDSLSPHLSKLLSAVLRRLRDPDSSVRSACVSATYSISSHITKPPFTSILKPLVDSLVTEQDYNAQIGAALCLSAAIEAAPDPDPAYLKKLLPRLEKLVRSDSFKAKPALLTVIGSVIGAGAASSRQVVKSLVPCLVEFIGSEDWAARRAAAEALVKLAAVDGDLLAEFRVNCLKTFEARKFDKVKIVRETMNQLVEAWKEIPNEVSVSPPPHHQTQSPSREDASDGRYPPGSKTSSTVTSGAPHMRKKNIPANRSFHDGSVVTTARKTSPLDSSDKKSGPAMFRKLDRKKLTDCKIEIAPSMTVVCEDDPRYRDEKDLETDETVRSRFTKPETKRCLFSKKADEKMLKFGSVRTGSRVVPCHDENLESTIVASNITEGIHQNQKECEDLSLICKQLVHIENQQSSLLDLLQKFMGSSQNGMRSLETRVHGLELALDEISYDLAVSTGKISNTDDSEGTTCCKLPGAEFLSPKFWRRTETRHSTSWFSSSGGTPSMSAVRNTANDRRFRPQGSGGFILNPLAEIPSDFHGMPEVSSNRVPRNIQDTI